MKKITISLIILLTAALFSGCGPVNEEGEKIKIVATVFPVFDLARELIRDCEDDITLSLLMDRGTDLHSFQPTAKDMIEISSCDVFIYIGGESDGWVKDALKEAVNKDIIALNLLEALGSSARNEEIREGMEGAGPGDEEEYDEHIWLSPKNAVLISKAVEQALEKAAPGLKNTLAKNLEELLESLNSLDRLYTEAISASRGKTLVFGDRFPFLYLVKDYGLDYYAAFSGCSAETEASFGTIRFLADRVDELSVPVILTIDGSDGKIAGTVRDNTVSKDQQILMLDSMQSVTNKDIEAGITYISVMEKNLEVLRTALGSGK